MKRTHWLWTMAMAALLQQGAAQATVIFTDDFNAGASASWGNERGSWAASGGVYDAASPSNSPLTYSSLPFSLTDFAIDVDINDVGDGGIWLRSDAAGNNGVLLVTGGNGWGYGGGSGGHSLYWHVVTGGSAGGTLNEASGVFADPGVDDVHLYVTAIGNTYSVYVNGSATAATTLTDSTFSSGRVGLYDFSSQTFDNVVLNDLANINGVPEPGTLALLGIGLMGLAAMRRQRVKAALPF